MTLNLKKSPCPLVIHDFMVLAHMVYSYVKKLEKIYKKENLNLIIKAHWALRINRGPDCLSFFDNYRNIIICDKKFEKKNTYWRQEEIKKDPRMDLLWEAFKEKDEIDNNHPQSYKGTRGAKSELLLRVISIGKDYCKKFFPFYEQEGYEADDIASAIYRYSRDSDSNCKKRQIIFHTIDRDWTQLVDNSHECYWASTRYPKKRERIQSRFNFNEDVIHHTKVFYDRDINHPRELIRVKTEIGDMGDNLPPGTPTEYMDLIEPPEKWKVENLKWFNELKNDLNNLNPLIYTDHYYSSKRELKRRHLLPMGNYNEL